MKKYQKIIKFYTSQGITEMIFCGEINESNLKFIVKQNIPDIIDTTEAVPFKIFNEDGIEIFYGDIFEGEPVDIGISKESEIILQFGD